MKLSLNNNFNRDLFALVIRTCVAHSDHFEENRINPEQINQHTESQSVKESKIVETSKEKA